MSEPIRIYIDYGPGSETGHRVNITPDIARQIVAMALGEAINADVAWKANAEASQRGLARNVAGLVDSVSAVFKRIKALESKLAGPEPFLGSAHQSELERSHQPAAQGDETPGDHIRNAFAAVGAPMVGKGVRADQPDAQGDEAAVRALLAIKTGSGAHALHGLQREDDARAILAAIRRGEVPLPDDVPQIASLRKKLAEAVGVIEHAKSDPLFSTRMRLANLLGAKGVPGATELCTAADALRTQRDGLAAQVAELTREAEARVKGNAEARRALMEASRATEAERDRALAELAEILQRIRGGTWRLADDGRRCGDDLAAARAELARLTGDLAKIAAERDFLRVQCTNLEAELREAKRDAEEAKMRANRAHADAFGPVREARAEAELLRALLKEACDEYLGDVDDDATWTESNRKFRDKCRAAGVEVEG